ncbi:PecA family PE domain-processing aspartic protease [Candidatus Mycobacterium wuenschmannii]|uniref:PecA family PE domain-processing aspartic protease n=1 Tax=Candidatus Mycobacterium wuenschmannii TaxID=3027808 RepID=A0ABY8W091_9MYCO|nr:PecA family PE domain-processing aspartic protease [Candidatus Mycobacterium wuenschmannii]WIM88645.1 PecA family PE domain-processing aspartic protease [Candidatus Mycobacterium wuenschmannii]
MARRLRSKLVSLGASAGALAAAAAIATGSAAPAKADLDDLFDPIISSLTDSIAVFDPAFAVDFTSWADELLDSLNAFDFLWPTTDSAFAAAATGALPAADVTALPNAVIPMEVVIGTEPVVYATVEGGDEAVPLLVDTGSGGLVIPSTLLGDNYSEQLQNLFELGLPSGIGSSGYSGGVSYIYLTYDSVSIDYTNLAGTATVLETDGPANIEVYSYAPGNFASLFTNDAFQNFLAGNNVDGILGVGYNDYGPTVTPFADYDGVLIDIPNNQLVIGDYDTTGWVSTDGAPISTVIESANGVTRTLSVNLDSGGVFGTIPSALAPGSDLGEQLPDGVLISVTNAEGEELYSYTTGQTDISNDGTPQLVSNGPYVVSGNYINSGMIPFLNHQVYLDYSGSIGTTYFSPYIP